LIEPTERLSVIIEPPAATTRAPPLGLIAARIGLGAPLFFRLPLLLCMAFRAACTTILENGAIIPRADTRLGHRE
jgi:hypothetical protein